MFVYISVYKTVNSIYCQMYGGGGIHAKIIIPTQQCLRAWVHDNVVYILCNSLVNDPCIYILAGFTFDVVRNTVAWIMTWVDVSQCAAFS